MSRRFVPQPVLEDSGEYGGSSFRNRRRGRAPHLGRLARSQPGRQAPLPREGLRGTGERYAGRLEEQEVVAGVVVVVEHVLHVAGDSLGALLLLVDVAGVALVGVVVAVKAVLDLVASAHNEPAQRAQNLTAAQGFGRTKGRNDSGKWSPTRAATCFRVSRSA